MKRLQVTILGSGCSTGVPRADGYWGQCDPANPKNRRSRCSAWLSLSDETAPGKSTSVVIDTAPDFREQAIRAGISHVDAVLWTHDHADQTHGLDDLRPFIFARGRPIDGYMDDATHATLIERFRYSFKGNQGYPPVYNGLRIPSHGVPWQVEGEGGALPVVTFDQEHGPIRSVGYKVGNFAYSSDLNGLPEASFAALEGLDLWVVDCLRHHPHPTHSHMAQTLEWIARLRPRHAVLTNLHQDLDYETLRRQLPANIEPAYDQMRLQLNI